MNREIETDGFITREQDLPVSKQICATCEHWKYDRGWKCEKGKAIGDPDWRQKYSTCDSWEQN